MFNGGSCSLAVWIRVRWGPGSLLLHSNEQEGASEDYLWDDPDMKNKLGQLWTWATVSTEPKFAVKAAKDIMQTACLMPRWKGETDNWVVEHGVHENRTMMDARRRPPFPKKCDCGLE